MLVKGPFNLKWGEDEIRDVESIEINSEIRSEEYVSNRGATYELDRSHKVSVIIVLLATDIAALDVVLPQHHIPQGADLNPGESIGDEEGAFQYALPQYDDEIIYNNLEITPCSDNPQVTRIRHARTRLAGIENDGKVQKVRVEFLGEPELGRASIQMFRTGDASANILLLEDSDPFQLGDNDTLLVE